VFSRRRVALAFAAGAALLSFSNFPAHAAQLPAAPGAPRTASSCVLYVGSTCVVPGTDGVKAIVDPYCGTVYYRLGRTSSNCTNGVTIVPIVVHTPDGSYAINVVRQVVQVAFAAERTVTNQAHPAVQAGTNAVSTVTSSIIPTALGYVANPLQLVTYVSQVVGGAAAQGNGGYQGPSCPQSTGCSNLTMFEDGDAPWYCCSSGQQGWFHGDYWYSWTYPTNDPGDGNVYDFINQFATYTSNGDALCGLHFHTNPTYQVGHNTGYYPQGTQYTNNGGGMTISGGISAGGASVNISYSTGSRGYTEGDFNPNGRTLTGNWVVNENTNDTNDCVFQTATVATGIGYYTDWNTYPGDANYDMNGVIEYVPYESDCC
jgi:hypothetical protein